MPRHDVMLVAAILRVVFQTFKAVYDYNQQTTLYGIFLHKYSPSYNIDNNN